MKNTLNMKLLAVKFPINKLSEKITAFSELANGKLNSSFEIFKKDYFTSNPALWPIQKTFKISAKKIAF